MAIPEHLGRHRLELSGDVLKIVYDGPITLDNCLQLRVIFGEMRQTVGRCFLLVDMRKSTGVEPAARKYMADWSKETPDEALSGTAMYGINFAMRAIITLTLNAIKFLGNKSEVEGVVFLKDEPEARRWLDARRTRLLNSTGDAHVGR